MGRVMKNRTKEEMAIFAGVVYEEKQAGAKYTELAIKHDCNISHISRAIRKHKDRLKLHENPIESTNSQFENSLMKCIEHNPEFIDVKVYAGGDNYLSLQIQKPKTKNVDKFDLELKKQIAESLSFSVETKFTI